MADHLEPKPEMTPSPDHDYGRARRTRRAARLAAVLLLLALIAASAAWYLRRGDGGVTPFRTAQVSRGDLLVSISATGTVEPEEVVDVGAQVAGQIMAFGRDVKGKTIDYGSMVEDGTVLAMIDDSVYSADAAQAEAQVRSARASVQRAQAELDQLKARLRQAERDWDRAKKLGPSEALSQASYDAYRSAYETAKATVAIGEAAILQAKASVIQTEASQRKAQRNLGYCIIKSPVKGVIIDRRVNIGQTVVASLNAPSLFLIAKDLTRMQVWVAVNEADIGKIRPGQPVTFTVDAFPGETFRGEVSKIRLNASMTQNVVTYTVEITTDNSNGRLLPYLTANVQFELDRRSDVLTIPNSALRWRPSVDLVVPDIRKAIANRAARKSAKTKDAGNPSSRSLLWVADGNYVRPIRVRSGMSDGINTEVEGEGLSEGMIIVTGLQTPENSQPGTKNPFTPQFSRRSMRAR